MHRKVVSVSIYERKKKVYKNYQVVHVLLQIFLKVSICKYFSYNFCLF